MADCALWSHETELAAEAISASRARNFVCLQLDAHGLEYLRDDIELVVSELATNAMVHAQTPFKVILRAFDQTVLLEVEDGSRFMPFRVEARPLDMGGRGIAIVDQLSCDWGVGACADGSKSVWAEFNRQ